MASTKTTFPQWGSRCCAWLKKARLTRRSIRNLRRLRGQLSQFYFSNGVDRAYVFIPSNPAVAVERNEDEWTVLPQRVAPRWKDRPVGSLETAGASDGKYK
ncbi:hypothetical protein DBV15_00189 [Temnothorax longispinosus]|uniref:Uncharacterized protein n=1 Tax=Temnothorax longispinosus TaxID=300112 RepID=A0A4S2KDV1_9HYME|nr:hypothetical protein DBV15_00189 [Temnothorax longispinosus]